MNNNQFVCSFLAWEYTFWIIDTTEPFSRFATKVVTFLVDKLQKRSIPGAVFTDPMSKEFCIQIKE